MKVRGLRRRGAAAAAAAVAALREVSALLRVQPFLLLLLSLSPLEGRARTQRHQTDRKQQGLQRPQGQEVARQVQWVQQSQELLL
jgi:hypothetical protein